MKKWILNGDRLSSNPMYPHSNGLLFSSLLFSTPEHVNSISINNKAANKKDLKTIIKYFMIIIANLRGLSRPPEWAPEVACDLGCGAAPSPS